MGKKTKKRFDVVKAVKSAARNVVGPPPSTRREESSTKKRLKRTEKHKVTLGRLLAEE